MMNRVVLVGRLTKEPDLKYTPSGAAVVTFTLAVNRSFTNQAGEREADFINCVVWRKAAENVANYLKKGSLAGVDGRLQTRNYEGNDGKRVYVTEVIAESVQFLEPKKSDNQQHNNAQYTQQPNDNQYNQNNRSHSQGAANDFKNSFVNDGKPINILDDDLPF